MNGLEVVLPGGLLTDEGIVRRVGFKELSGHLELALTGLDVHTPKPVYVKNALTVSLQSIGDHPIAVDEISSLCTADCQFLMLRLTALLVGEQQWLKVTCVHCESFFDVAFRCSDLPVKTAGPGFPFVDVDLADGNTKVRVPSTADQMDLVGLTDQESMVRLLQNCIYSVNQAPPFRDFNAEFSESDIAAIDEALDRISPAVCNELLVVCPECSTEQKTSLDHCLLPGLDGSSLFDEVHTLAMNYHWSEKEILDMTRSRRYRYLGLIDRSHAMSGQLE